MNIKLVYLVPTKIKTSSVGIVLILGVYCFGIATGHYRYFPLDVLFDIKQDVDINGESSKNFDVD